MRPSPEGIALNDFAFGKITRLRLGDSRERNRGDYEAASEDRKDSQQTMDYELAQQLKDAGFPGMDKPWPSSGHFVLASTPVQMPDGSIITGAALPAPTLEELIKACGDGFFSLLHMMNPEGITGFIAWAEDGDTYYHGVEPDEAVARLWLALQEQRKTDAA